MAVEQGSCCNKTYLMFRFIDFGHFGSSSMIKVRIIGLLRDLGGWK